MPAVFDDSGPTFLVRSTPAREVPHPAPPSPMHNGFLDLLAHELRSPLQAMLGWSQYLRLPLEPSMRDRGLEAIERNVRWQAQVIDDLLERAQLLEPGFRLERVDVPLGPLLERAISGFAGVAGKRGIHLSGSAWPEGSGTFCDPLWIERAVLALLRNAFRHTLDGGSIGVALERTDGTVGIAIADESRPLPAEPTHLFDAFRGGDPSETSSFMTLGVGLANAQKITELHGGSVRAASAGAGRGARFEMLLPSGEARGARRP